jgi:hypothetical protein
MLYSRMNPKIRERKLNLHIYYKQKEKSTMKCIENSEPKKKKEEISDQNCLEKGNDLLVKDQIKTTASAISGSQLIVLSYSENHETPLKPLYFTELKKFRKRNLIVHLLLQVHTNRHRIIRHEE